VRGAQRACGGLCQGRVLALVGVGGWVMDSFRAQKTGVVHEMRVRRGWGVHLVKVPMSEVGAREFQHG